jgi:RNA polymerase sigma factor (sigma-70 family)
MSAEQSDVDHSGQAERMTAAVSAAAAGDETAFARIVAEFHEDMCRVAYVICQDTEIAHEAVQDAWSIAWRQLPKLREPERLKSWLVAIAANEARQMMRRQRRRTIVELKVERPYIKDSSTIWSGSVDLRNALKILSPEDRQLLALRYVAGIDSFELSRVTGLSPSGTRARLQRILAALRSELGSGNA